MEQKDLTRIQATIEKLLAKAKDAAMSAEEAEAFAVKAQELLTRHKLTEAQVRNSKEPENFGTTLITKKWQDVEDKFILNLLNEHFAVQCVTSRDNGQFVIYILGTTTECEIAHYVYDYLLRSFRLLWKAYNSVHRAGKGARQAYCVGLWSGLITRLKASRKAVEQEMGLMVIENLGLQRYVNEVFPRLRNSTARVPIRDLNAQNAGYHDGRNLHIGRGIRGGCGAS